MRKIITVLVTSIFLCSYSAGAQEVKNGLTWYTDVQKVYELSTKTKKPVFAFFTGSDWCGWCHRLEANVLTKPGFIDWAKKNVILLELDFPRHKKLPDELAKQNNELLQFFQVRGFPTVWVFNMIKDKTANKFSISALGSLGYPTCEAGKEEATFLANANKILKNK